MRYPKVVGAKIDEKTYRKIEEKAKELEMNRSELLRIILELGLAVLEKGDYKDRRIVINAPINLTISMVKSKTEVDRETIRELIEWLQRIASKTTDYPMGLKNIAQRSLAELQKLLNHD